MSKFWFRRKLYGWGWTPSSWEGWIVLLIYLIYIISKFKKVDALSHPGSDTLIGLTVPVVISTIILIGICYETGEAPRWQWGKRREN